MNINKHVINNEVAKPEHFNITKKKTVHSASYLTWAIFFFLIFETKKTGNKKQ